MVIFRLLLSFCPCSLSSHPFSSPPHFVYFILSLALRLLLLSLSLNSHFVFVRWNDIIGLDNARRLAKEAIVYPIKYPQLFSGITAPWKGLLLYGPSGTGTQAAALLIEENERLKSIIKEMRADVEAMHQHSDSLAR